MLPKVAAVIVVLVVGYIVARIVARGVHALAGRVGLDSAAERSGLAESMKKVGIQRGLSAIVAQLFFWLLMCVFLMTSFSLVDLPELTAAATALHMGAADLAVASLYGSNVCNIAILFVADPFYRDGILVNQTVPSHFIAGGVAIGLMLVGLVLILGRHRLSRIAVTSMWVLMILVTIAAAATVIFLGATEDDDDSKAVSNALESSRWQSDR